MGRSFQATLLFLTPMSWCPFQIASLVPFPLQCLPFLPPPHTHPQCLQILESISFFLSIFSSVENVFPSVDYFFCMLYWCSNSNSNLFQMIWTRFSCEMFWKTRFNQQWNICVWNANALEISYFAVVYSEVMLSSRRWFIIHHYFHFHQIS